jgi:hypothetical protein
VVDVARELLVEDQGGAAQARARVLREVQHVNAAEEPAPAPMPAPAPTPALGGSRTSPTTTKLSTGVAMHFWYDFLLSASAFAIDPQHQPFVVQYASPC